MFPQKYLYDVLNIKRDKTNEVDLLKEIRRGGQGTTPQGIVSNTKISNSSQNVNHPKQKSKYIIDEGKTIGEMCLKTLEKIII